MLVDAGVLHGLFEMLQILVEPTVPADLQEIGAGRDRHEPARDAVGEVVFVHRRGETDRTIRAVGLSPFLDEPQRDDVQRRAAQIHDLVLREERAVIDDFERVAEFRAETKAELLGRRGEPSHHVDAVVELQAGIDRFLVDLNVGVTEPVVEQMVDLFQPEHGRVHLDRDVHAGFGQQEMANPLDLVRRTIVERRERDRVADLGRVGEVAELFPAVGDLLPEFVDVLARVAQVGDEIADPLVGDAVEIVAEAEIVDGRGLVERAGLELEEIARLEHLDQHHAGDVFVNRFIEPQFLRELDVVADVGHVDARAVDDQLIVDLDGLEFENARPGNPTQRDVLRQLCLRAGRRTDRRRGFPPVKRHARVERRIGPIDLLQRQVEDGLLPLRLEKHAGDEIPKRCWM